MKKTIINALLIIPFLTSCGGGNNELIIKVVDKDYTPTLPEFKKKDSGDILSDENYVYFDFYEISDFHGATNYVKDDKVIGLERLSSYYDKKRETNKGGTILLSSGDMWQGSTDSNVTRGNLVTYGMDVMNFEAMTLGNHEFDWTVEWIKNNKSRATFPFLCANLIDKATGKIADFVSASKVIERGDYKIGVVGTIGDTIKSTIFADAVKDFDFADEISTVASETQKLREQGCDIVVWTSHNDITDLKNKAGINDLDVDLIFGGHSHTGYTLDLGGVPMLEAKDLGRALPHAQLKIDKVTSEVTSSIVEIDDNPTSTDLSPDIDISGIYNQYNEKYIKPVKEQDLGKAEGDFSLEQLGNYAVEVMFNKIKQAYPDSTCRAAFTNINGGVRSKLASGKVNYGNIYEAFPFDNELVIMETTGKKLQTYASGGVSNVAQYQNIYTYGALESKDNYLFITTDYLATNSSFFKNAGEVKTYTKITLRDCVAEAIKKAGTIKADNYKTTAKKEFQKIS